MAVYIKQSPPREGVRGGWEDFSWDLVKNQPGGDRDHYLGASVKVGLHSHGGKLEKHDWWTKEKTRDPTGEAAVSELERLKKFETQLMDEALGLRPRQLLAGGSLEDDVPAGKEQDVLPDGCTVFQAQGLSKKELKRIEKQQKKLAKRRRKEEKRALRRLKKVKQEDGCKNEPSENGESARVRPKYTSHDTNNTPNTCRSQSPSCERRQVQIRSSVKKESSAVKRECDAHARTEATRNAMRSRGEVCHSSDDSESMRGRYSKWHDSHRRTVSNSRCRPQRERCTDFSETCISDQLARRRTHQESEDEGGHRETRNRSPKRSRKRRSPSSTSESGTHCSIKKYSYLSKGVVERAVRGRGSVRDEGCELWKGYYRSAELKQQERVHSRETGRAYSKTVRPKTNRDDLTRDGNSSLHKEQGRRDPGC